MATSAIGWPPWLSTFWHFWIWRNFENYNQSINFFRDPVVSNWDQSRWPSNCTGFHSHHVMGEKSTQEDESPPNKQCSILSDRHWGEPSQSTKGPICVSYTAFHNPVGRSSERIFSLTIDLLGRETPCKRHKLVLSLTGRKIYKQILRKRNIEGKGKWEREMGFCKKKNIPS